MITVVELLVGTFSALGSLRCVDVETRYGDICCLLFQCRNENGGRVFVYIVTTSTRLNMSCLATAGKHINNIQAIFREPPITTEKLLGAVIPVEPAPSLYNENPRPAELNSQR